MSNVNENCTQSTKLYAQADELSRPSWEESWGNIIEPSVSSDRIELQTIHGLQDPLPGIILKSKIDNARVDTS